MDDVTMLKRFIQENNVTEVEQALAQGLPPNLRDEQGWTLLMVAADRGVAEIVESLRCSCTMEQM